MLLICGQADTIWPSCTNAAAIQTRLDAHHKPVATVLSYAGAGHFAGAAVPYLPDTASTGQTAGGVTLNAGGTYLADQAAHADAWPKLLRWVATGKT